MPFGSASLTPHLDGGNDMKSIWRVALAVLTALAIWSVSGTALAVKPVKEYFSFFDSGFKIVECDGFDVLSDSTLEGFFLLYFDRDGNLVSAREHIRFVDDVWYNSEHPEISIDAGPSQVENLQYDFLGDPPTILIAGLQAKVTLPGYGVVFQEAGNIVVDLNTDEVIRSRGPSDLTDGNGEVICPLLSS